MSLDNMDEIPAGKMLHVNYMLVADAKEKEITAISLEATKMERPLYEKFGFIKMNDEMELPGIYWQSKRL